MLYVCVLSCDVSFASMGVSIAKGTFCAKKVASVEGIAVETTGTKVWGYVVDSIYLDCTAFSNSCSVSFNCSFNLRTKSIISSSFFFSITSEFWGWVSGGNFNYFRSAAMSSFLSLIKFYVSLTSFGLWLNSITKSSSDFICYILLVRRLSLVAIGL